jgi:predicted O-methyltransferase YrrM
VRIYPAIKFLKYFLISSHKKGHGIHSPFVFNLVTNVFRNKINPDIVCKIEMTRKKMINDKRVIEVTDLGAGSENNNRKLRKVSEIARYSSVPEKYGKLIGSLSSAYGKNCVIEFGTSLGISTMYMAAANPETTVYTMEGSAALSDLAGENFIDAGLKNINILNGSFESLLPGIEEKKLAPGLVFIDGNHRKQPTIEYFNRIFQLSDGNTVIVIDDINYSSEMQEAWNEIISDERVSFSVDLWRMGIIFFREGMTHFNYIIRY